MMTGLKVVSRTVHLTWLAGIVALIALVALPHVLPAFGRDVYIVRGASMQPAIPIGSVVVVDRIDPSQIQASDVITFRAPSGGVVTHRVMSILAAGELAFTTRGDANPADDPVAVPASSVIGRVEESIPGIGLVIAVLATTGGSLSALGVLASLVLIGWFVEELARTNHRPAAVPRPAARPVR